MDSFVYFIFIVYAAHGQIDTRSALFYTLYLIPSKFHKYYLFAGISLNLSMENTV